MSNSVSIYDALETSETRKKPKKGKKRWSKKKKIITSVICLIIVAALVINGILFIRQRQNSSSSYAYIRTTTLAKGTLENSISTTGTVESAKSSNVTTQLSYTVKDILVSVGDEVKEGDVICTLDTSDLEEQIEREEKNLSTALEEAQSSYDSAFSNYSKAESALSSSQTELNDAKADKESAYTPYKNAKNAVSSYQSAYSKALSNYNSAGAEYVKALNNYNTAVRNYKKNKIGAGKLTSAAKAYMKAVLNYYGGCSVKSYDISDSSSSLSSGSAGDQGSMSGNSLTSVSGGSSNSESVTVSKTADEICREVADNVYSLCKKRVSYSSGTNTLYKLSSCAEKLKQAKLSCNYDQLESEYNEAKNAYETAKSAYEQNENTLEQAESQLTQAKNQLSSASSSDTLEELKSQLEECTITANQSGTIISLNAVIGSSANQSAGAAGSTSALATISNQKKLKVSITIAEANINDASIGMSCYITSDASDETINGTLTQIDPVANENSSFGAEVTVDSEDTSLKVGMNASVELLVSSKDGVYQVPIDAVGNDGDGDFVYRKISGEGTDMEFEKVYITTGEKNDYYIEISSSDLSEGDVIRSSSDLDEGIETGETKSSESQGMGFLFGGSGGERSGGNMPDMGGSPDMKNSGSPSGGFPGGES